MDKNNKNNIENKKIIALHPDLSSRYQADKAKEKNIIGKKINAARKKLGITQTDFAKSLSPYGVRIKTPGVNKWENGETVPNAYQLLAVCHALQIEGGLEYFTGPLIHRKEILNTEGLRMLHQFREFLESRPKYTNQHQVEIIRKPVSLYPASAGIGDFLDDEQFEWKEFPASAVPGDADFAVPVDGDSMEPLYVNGQLAWVQLTPQLNVGETGLFVIDGEGFIKTYDERLPDEQEREMYLDSNGVLHPQIVLISQNEKFGPKIIKPGMNFRIIGRVLN